MPEKENILSIQQTQALCLRQNIPFYSYRMPNEDTIYTGMQLTETSFSFESITALSGMQGFVLMPYCIKADCPAIFIKEDIRFTDSLNNQEIADKLHATRFPEKERMFHSSDSEKPLYLEQVNALISALQNGEARKAVFSRSITVQGEALQKAPELFEKMVKCYPAAFVFLVSSPGNTVWIGATPEIFLQQTPRTLHTMALAGTQPVKDGQSCGEWEYKDREEQQIVSDYIRDILSGICPEKTNSTGPFTRKAGNVYHLCTTFECEMQPDTAKADHLRELLHPTPAVGGFPKAQALQLISRLEQHERRYYAGYLGPVRNDGTFDLFVNLRSMELYDNAYRLYAGGGITALSDAGKEWQ